MSTTTATAPTSTTTCVTCGQVFCYEPILVMGKDFGATLVRTCETCSDAADKAEREAIAERDRIETESLIASTIPVDLLETDTEFPSFNRGLWDLVSKWKPSRGTYGLGLIGPADRSKTRCMALLCARGMRKGIKAVWISAIDLYECARDANHRDRRIYEPAREKLREASGARVLYIDDFGKNEWSMAFEIQLFKILDHRKNHRLPTIYSSNAHPEEFGLVISDLNREPIIGRMLDRVTIFDLRPSKS